MLPTLRSLFFIVLLSSLSFYGCEQKDSSVGSDLATGLDEIYPQEVIVDPVAGIYYQAQATTGNSPYLYLGRLQGYDADALLKFNPYSALPDSYQVDSLVVKLYLDSVFAAGSSSLDISVFFVNRSQEWTETGVSWENLDSLQLGNAISSFSVPTAPADSDSVSFSLPQPDSLLRAWEWAGSGGKTLHFNNGLYLQSEKSWESMVRFASSENAQINRRPKLEMYVTVFDTSDTTGWQPADTTLYIYAINDAFIADDFSILDADYLYLGNSVAYWSLLLFDLNGLFPTFGVGVQRAEVILHADTANGLNQGQISKAYTIAMQDTSWLQDPSSAPIAFGSTQGPTASYDEEAATLTLNLNDMVYDWIRHPETNAGFLIISSNENYDLSRTVFYGIGAPDSLRPRLRIVYLEGGP